MNFTEAKHEFDNQYGTATEYYKGQFFYSTVQSGLFAKDYIGREVQFPKGHKSSAPLKLDGAIFGDKERNFQTLADEQLQEFIQGR